MPIINITNTNNADSNLVLLAFHIASGSMESLGGCINLALFPSRRILYFDTFIVIFVMEPASNYKKDNFLKLDKLSVICQ